MEGKEKEKEKEAALAEIAESGSSSRWALQSMDER